MTQPQSDTEKQARELADSIAKQNPAVTASEGAANLRIQGEPLPLDELLDFATIDPSDLESAADWWDEYASPEWVGALDSEPVKGDKK